MWSEVRIDGEKRILQMINGRVRSFADDAFVGLAARSSPSPCRAGHQGRGTDERQRIVAIHPAGCPVQQCAADADGVEARAEPRVSGDVNPRKSGGGGEVAGNAWT